MTDTAPPRIFSVHRRSLAAARARQRQAGDDAAAFVIEDIVEDIAERLAFMRQEPVRGCLVGLPGAALASLPGTVESIAADQLDEELPWPSGGFDFIGNTGSLAVANDLPGALVHIRSALAPGGIAILSVVGAGSCANLRRAMLAAEPDRPAARMHPLIDNRAATALLERAGFSRFVVDSRSIEVAYRSLARLVSDLRDQALGNQLAGMGPPLDKAALERARRAFLAHADADGRVIERFEILTLTGWR